MPSNNRPARLDNRPPVVHAAAAIADRLDRLADLRAAEALARAVYESRRTDILAAVQTRLDALQNEFAPTFQAHAERIALLENEVRANVLVYGASVRGRGLYAVYYHGRVSWDNDGMARYAETHPDVLAHRKQGQPSVALRSAPKADAALLGLVEPAPCRPPSDLTYPHIDQEDGWSQRRRAF